MRFHRILAAAALCALAAGCGSSQSTSGVIGGDDDTNVNPPSTEGAPKVPVAESREGTIYDAQFTSSIGDVVTFTVMEPTRLEVAHSYPLVLHGHGYGGHRNTAPDDFQQQLRDAGYYVLSFDQRGFGDAGGTIRVMDPEYEGVNYTEMLDWAEDLEGLRRRGNGEMMVGSYGGSYGGMYQVMLWAVDPKHRLRVLAPDITPHDLNYALDPHNVVKSGWGLLLSVAGEGAPVLGLTGGFVTAFPPNQLPPHQDLVIYETLFNAVLTNAFSESSTNFFQYHSFRYFCDGQPAGAQNFLLATPDLLLVPPTPPPAADVLLTQGIRDTLFNFNDGWHNYQCMKQLGGDVRLFTHQTGHLLPAILPADAEAALDAFYAALTLANTQEAGGSRTCGDVDLETLTFAWFEEKLRSQNGAIATALGGDSQNVCMSLAEGEAVEIAESTMKAAGQEYPIDGSVPQFNAALGTITSLQGTGAREALLANQTLLTAPEGGLVLAGIPKLSLTITGLTGAEMPNCATPELTLGCDPILLLAIGHRPAGQTRWQIIDDQLTPVRGFGAHDLEMTGISGRFGAGEEIALLIYGFHAQFPVTWSRDVFVPAVNLSGTLDLPIRGAADILRTRVIADETR